MIKAADNFSSAAFNVYYTYYIKTYYNKINHILFHPFYLHNLESFGQKFR